MSRNKKLCIVVLTIVSLILATQACGAPADSGTPGTASDGPSVTISSPPSGTAVTVGKEVSITSMASAGAGVARVELSASGACGRRSTVGPRSSVTRSATVRR